MATIVVLPTGINLQNNLTAVPSFTETAIITYVVPALNNFYIVNANCTGTTNAIYRLRVNGVLQATRISDASHLNVDFEFSDSFGFRVQAGNTVTITVENTSSVNGDFFCNLTGGLQS